MKQRLDTGQGADIIASSPAACGEFLAAQAAEWGRIVRERDIRVV